MAGETCRHTYGLWEKARGELRCSDCGAVLLSVPSGEAPTVGGFLVLYNAWWREPEDRRKNILKRFLTV